MNMKRCDTQSRHTIKMVRSKQVWQSTKQGRKVAVRCSKKHINRLCIERWGKCKTHRNAIQFNAKRYWIGLHTINTAAGDCSLPTIVGRRPRHCQGSPTKCLMPQNINDLRDQYPQGVSKWVSICVSMCVPQPLEAGHGLPTYWRLERRPPDLRQ